MKYNNKKELVCVDIGKPNILADDKVPYIFVTEFDDASISDFYKMFLKLQDDPTVKVIPIVITSYGGSVHNLLSMIDIINSSTKPVATIAMGKAMSAGAVLLAHGHNGYRYSFPNTDIMLHEVSTVEWGKTSDIENGSKHTKTLNKTLFELLAERANKKDKAHFIKEMKKRNNVDWFLTAEEYKKLGLIDHVSVPLLIKK